MVFLTAVQALKRAILPVCLAILVTGCVDGTFDAGSGSDAVLTSASKIRHRHLFHIPTSRSGKVAADGETARLVITLDYSANPDSFSVEANKFLGRYKLLGRYEFQNVFYGLGVEVDESRLAGLLDSLASDPDVRYAEPDIFMGIDPGLAELFAGTSQLVPWGIQRIGATESITASGDGAGTVSGVDLYVLDTGVRRVDLNLQEKSQFVEELRTRDELGHGMHVAGTAAGKDNDKWFVGVAPGADVYGLKVLDDNGESEMSNVIAALEQIVGAKQLNPNLPVVVNMSFGANIGTTENTALDDAVEKAIESGIVVVASAGNEGIDASTVTPAHAVGVITVGAYDPLNQFAPFSNHGSTVDILAPGVQVLSTGLDANGLPARIAMDGTSMAAPHVAGAAALFLSENPYASPAQVLEAIKNSGRAQIMGTPAGTTNKTVFVGEGGLLDQQVPPFFQYAITAGGSIEMEGNISVINDGSGNASVFTNDSLLVSDPGPSIQGFGYYGTGTDVHNSVLQPNYNPADLPTALQIEPITIPTFNADDYIGIATQTTMGPLGLSLSGNYTLGTPDNPVIWYVEGDLETDGPVTISGSGIFVVKGNIQIEHSISTPDGTAHSSLGLYANGELQIQANGVALSAQIFVNGAVETQTVNTVIRGSITTAGEVQQAQRFTLYYVPASTDLTEPIWPSNGQ